MRNSKTLVVLSLLFTFAFTASVFPQDSVPQWTVEDVAQSVEQLWQGYDPRREALNVKSVRSWQQDGVHVHYIVYTVGRFRGKDSTVAAFYTTPLDTTKKYPAVVNIHGGGQRAYLRGCIEYAQRGYCCISPNWGGREMETAEPGDLNTDWGAVDPTQSNPQGYSSLLPGPNKIDPFQSPRNNHWYLLTIACRRAITFLEQQTEVDAERLGVLGHSMGGRLTGLVAGSDPRVKAASPSVGGSGFLYEDIRMITNSARRQQGSLQLLKSTITGEAYLKRVQCPILFLSATNDFNAPMESVEKGMNLVPHQNKRTTYAVHLNHRFTPEADIARKLWFDAHLKHQLDFPKTPKLDLKLKTPNGIPAVHLTPDGSREIEDIRIYYGYDRDPRNRFWASADARVAGNIWIASCPIYDLEEPLFVLANVHYKLEPELRHPRDPESFILSASASAYPEALKAARVTPTQKRQRIIDQLNENAVMRDWYILNPGNNHHWLYSTRKLVDPRFEAPLGGQLKITMLTDEPDNHVAIKAVTHSWRNYIGKRSKTFVAVAKLDKVGKHIVQLQSYAFKDDEGNILEDWDGITELQIQSADKALPDVPDFQPWNGSQLKLLGLEWEGGILHARPKPYPAD